MKRCVVSIFIFFCLLFTYGLAESLGDFDEVEQLKPTLMKLYRASGGENWDNNKGWGDASMLTCNWYGIHCEYNKDRKQYYVYKIDLHNNNLVGTFNSDEIGANLADLEILSLSNNHLVNIGNGFEHFTNLEALNISYNEIVGKLPDSLQYLSKLRSLVLHENNFSGEIKNTIFTNMGNSSTNGLATVKLSYNNFTGQIPDSLRYKKTLVSLYLDNNKLSGSIPSWIGELKKLKHLHLNNNNFSGSIPNSIGDLSSGYDIYLNNNKLTGSIPSSIGQLKASVIDFSYNFLSGEVPQSIVNLPDYTKPFLKFNANLYTNNDSVKQFLRKFYETTRNYAYDERSNKLYGAQSILNATYKHTNGKNWKINTNWENSTGQDICNRYGITCDADRNYVVSIDLSDNNLTGIVYLGTLGNNNYILGIKTIDFSHNCFDEDKFNHPYMWQLKIASNIASDGRYHPNVTNFQYIKDTNCIEDDKNKNIAPIYYLLFN